MVANVRPTEVWRALLADARAQVVDVRTDAEWAFVGLPDLSPVGREVITVPWQMFPTMQINADFLRGLLAAGCMAEDSLYFLCRSGVRSLHAALAAVEAGFIHSFNIADGFEGPCDGAGHRGMIAGWKAEGLPWRQR